jgi:hypothetical protein
MKLLWATLNVITFCKVRSDHKMFFGHVNKILFSIEHISSQNYDRIAKPVKVDNIIQLIALSVITLSSSQCTADKSA